MFVLLGRQPGTYVAFMAQKKVENMSPGSIKVESETL